MTAPNDDTPRYPDFSPYPEQPEHPAHREEFDIPGTEQDTDEQHQKDEYIHQDVLDNSPNTHNYDYQWQDTRENSQQHAGGLFGGNTTGNGANHSTTQDHQRYDYRQHPGYAHYQPGRQPQYNQPNYQKESNWPTFLPHGANQRLFALIALLLTLTPGMIGIALSAYYLFYLDDTHQKDKVAKTTAWIGIVAFLVIFFMLFSFGMASVIASV